jgi:hypothetical protein
MAVHYIDNSNRNGGTERGEKYSVKHVVAVAVIEKEKNMKYEEYGH